MEEYVRNGEKLFRAMYRDTADKVQALLDEIYPDMGALVSSEARGSLKLILDGLCRLVLEHRRLRHHVRCDRRAVPSRDLLRLGGCTDLDGYASPDWLAPCQCSAWRRNARGGEGCEADIHGSGGAVRNQMERWCPRTQLSSTTRAPANDCNHPKPLRVLYETS